LDEEVVLAFPKRFWLGGIDGGGGVRAVKLGPKEVRIDVRGCPLFESRYYRAAFRGWVTSVFELVSDKAYAHELRGGGADRSGISLRVQWA
jgi:hypothetical protein